MQIVTLIRSRTGRPVQSLLTLHQARRDAATRAASYTPFRCAAQQVRRNIRVRQSGISNETIQTRSESKPAAIAVA